MGCVSLEKYKMYIVGYGNRPERRVIVKRWFHCLRKKKLKSRIEHIPFNGY